MLTTFSTSVENAGMPVRSHASLILHCFAFSGRLPPCILCYSKARQPLTPDYMSPLDHAGQQSRQSKALQAEYYLQHLHTGDFRSYACYSLPNFMKVAGFCSGHIRQHCATNSGFRRRLLLLACHSGIIVPFCLAVVCKL